MSSNELAGKLAKWCASREVCVADAKAWLQRHECEPQLLQSIIEDARREGFINDQRYALAFARDRARFARWGERKIIASLRQKNIPEEFIQEALEAVRASNELPSAYNALQRKLASLTGDPASPSNRGKLLRYAASQGFPPDEAISALERLLENADYE